MLGFLSTDHERQKIKSDYSTRERGLEEIEKGLRALYTGKNGEDDRALAQTIAAVKSVYQRTCFRR